MDKKLDFERKTAYQLTIQAEDSGSPVRYDTASVSIYIEDVNDSPPVFLHSPYLAYLVENGEELPRYVTSVAARDKDNPPHNQVKYTMKDDSGAFSINGTTGDIFLHSALDRETFSHYELEVMAADVGQYHCQRVSQVKCVFLTAGIKVEVDYYDFYPLQSILLHLA